MTDLAFYTNPMSRGQIVRWLLEEVAADYDEVILDYAASMKAPAYRAINPMGKVPAIVHHGRVVTECAAICAYLAEAFPDAGLAPTEAERADYYRWLFFAAGPLEQAITDRHLNVVPTEDQMRMVGYGNYALAVDVLEGAVTAHPYIAGDRFTAADVYVGSQVIWGTLYETLPKRAAFVDYADRLTARPAYRTAKARDEALMPARASA
jgi:glutathione S-transferase